MAYKVRSQRVVDFIGALHNSNWVWFRNQNSSLGKQTKKVSICAASEVAVLTCPFLCQEQPNTPYSLRACNALYLWTSAHSGSSPSHIIVIQICQNFSSTSLILLHIILRSTVKERLNKSVSSAESRKSESQCGVGRWTIVLGPGSPKDSCLFCYWAYWVNFDHSHSSHSSLDSWIWNAAISSVRSPGGLNSMGNGGSKGGEWATPGSCCLVE